MLQSNRSDGRVNHGLPGGAPAVTLTSLRRRYAALLILRWLPVGLISPVLVLVVLDRGVSLAQVGPVLGAYSLVTLLAELPTGGMADAYGRRRTLVASSLLMVGFLAVLLLADGVVPLTLGAMLGGASRALDSGPLEAWFVDLAPTVDDHVDLERELARGSTVDGVTLSVGAIVGGLIGSVSGGSLGVVVLVAMIAQATHAAAAFALMTRDEQHDRDAPSPGVVIRSAFVTLRSSIVLRLLLVAGMAVGVALISIENLFQVRFDDLLEGRDATTTILGLLLSASFAASAAGAAAGPVLRRRSGLPVGRFLFVIVALQGACFALMAWADSGVPTALGMIGVYGLLGLAHPLAQTALHGEVGSSERTTMISAQSLSMQLGAFFGAVSLVPLASLWSIPSVWAVSGVIMVAAAVIYLGIDRARSPST